MKKKPFYIKAGEKTIIAGLFGLITVGAMAIPVVAHQNKFQNPPKLLDVFKDMADGMKKAFAPKAEPVIIVDLGEKYDCRQRSIVSSARLNEELRGVLKNKGQKIIEEARKNNLCPIFLTAVAMHESANGESKCARDKNNTFGIFDVKTGRHKVFNSVDECIEFSAKLLGKSKLYCGGKNFTIEKIQKIYCPVGAKNDPKGLNKHWLTGVLDKMKKIWGNKIYVAVI